MPDLSIHISQNAQNTLKKLAETSGEPIPIILEKALENYRRHLFLMQANQAFADLKKDETAWQEELEERQLWDITLADGVD